MLNDHRVFDVTLLAGHRDYANGKSDFSLEFVRHLWGVARDAQKVVRVLRPTSRGRLHFTLRAVYGDRSPEFRKMTRFEDRRRRYAQVMKWVKGAHPRRVLWQGYALTPDDVLILKGKAIGPWLLRLRRKIDRMGDQPPLYPPSSFCHMVMARPMRPLRVSERKKLHDRLQKQSTFKRQPMNITRPILVTTRNHFGTLYHNAGRAELVDETD